MGKRLERIGGFVVGILLFVFGFSLLQPDSGIAQTGINMALAAVLTALGIGVIAAAALPHTIEVSGQQFKPLGLDVKASGGAAVFLLTLGFIYYMKDQQGLTQPAPAPSATSSPAGTPTTETPPAEPSPPELLLGETPAGTPAAAASTAPLPAQALPAPTFFAWTWCSACCPQGPDYCEQVGIGAGPSAQLASARAIEQCAQNGGVPQTCAANVQFYAEGNEPY